MRGDKVRNLELALEVGKERLAAAKAAELVDAPEICFGTGSAACSCRHGIRVARLAA